MMRSPLAIDLYQATVTHTKAAWILFIKAAMTAPYSGHSMLSDVEGVHYAGTTVYLVADNLPNAQRVQQVLAHEAIDHAAQEDMLGLKVIRHDGLQAGQGNRRAGQQDPAGIAPPSSSLGAARAFCADKPCNRSAAAPSTIQANNGHPGPCWHRSVAFYRPAGDLRDAGRAWRVSAMTSHWLFFSIAVIHGVRRSEAAIDPKGLKTLASTSAVLQARRFTGKSRPQSAACISA